MNGFDLKIGFSCNNNCIHCVVAHKRPTKDLTTNEIKSIIKKRPKEECIIFTGGEPTIREDFFELLKYAKKKGHTILVQTNGTQFAKRDFAKEASKYINMVIIAIHSHKESIHDKIVQHSGMYKKTISGFKNIIKLQIPHEPQTVISKLNIEHLKETYDFIQSISPATKMRLTFPHPIGNAYHNRKQVVSRYSKIKIYIQKILKTHAPFLITEAIPLCYLYPYQDTVKNEDEKRFKQTLINIKGVDPYFKKDIINDYNALILNNKKKGTECKKCIFNNRCIGIWKEYVQLYNNNLDLYPVLDIRE